LNFRHLEESEILLTQLWHMDTKSVCQMIDRVLEILSISLSMMRAVTRAIQHQ
jgi:hypothetical protein